MLVKLERTVAPLLDKVTAKEMDVFTAHDRHHALKVAHLMWHITSPERRLLLTPSEIGLLVSSAFIHDLGMFLSNEEREKRLSPDSDLWDRLEIDAEMRQRIVGLETAAAREKVPAKQARLLRQLFQAQEALLCADNRDRHATRDRYNGIIGELKSLHFKDPTNIVDVEVAFSFEGDSYLEKLLDICVSHNESAEALVGRDPNNPDRPRFPRNFPIGSTTADTQFVAAALRMADVLDFDRERTPPVLYHYFLPSGLVTEDDRSAMEWSKHLAISNWQIEPEVIVFRGRCRNHIAHHGIVNFCSVIAEEISATLATFGSNIYSNPLFALPAAVKADIHSEGYLYVPYRFELDDERIYKLLMGGAIYDDPIHAIRELVQNAVDACSLRDALTRMHDRGMNPSADNRIFIRYTEPTSEQPHPILEVRDTGTGMDDWIINRWFLKVGRSYYSSPEFNHFRVRLRKENLDFAPVSEFGIGFLSTFLLADKVEVETAMWEPLRGDTKKRIFEIHGPTRLIHLRVQENTGADRFRGTSVRLTLSRGTQRTNGKPPTWEMVRAYLIRNCLGLPYRLHLSHWNAGSEDRMVIDPRPLMVKIPAQLSDYAVKFQVDDQATGLQGEIALIPPRKAREFESILARESAVRLEEEMSPSALTDDDPISVLVRGGFRIGSVPGLPHSYMDRGACKAVLKMDWKSRRERRYPLTNLARTTLADESDVKSDVVRIWLTYLLEHLDSLPEGLLDGFSAHRALRSLSNAQWLERFDAHLLYRLAANGWHSELRHREVTPEDIAAWENSEGEALSRSVLHDECYDSLQDIVLPKVCGLQMGPQGVYYFTPPVKHWVEILKGWREFVKMPVKWGNYVKYVGDIKDLLYYEYTGSVYLNSKHRERVESTYRESEIPELIDALRQLADNKKERRIDISTSALALLHRAQKKLGDLEIGELFQRWRIDSFKL